MGRYQGYSCICIAQSFSPPSGSETGGWCSTGTSGPRRVALGPAGRAALPVSGGELGRENAPLILNAIKRASGREIKRAPYLADREVW